MALLELSDGTGWLDRWADFDSRYVVPRNVDIWLPPGYSERPQLRYPVLYMHDGQNLFDPALSYTGVDWGVDEALRQRMQTSGWPGAIVVGAWNTPLRRREYLPEKPFDSPEGQAFQDELAEWVGGAPLSADYLRFLTQELKPFVDGRYRTLPSRQHTLVMGSSMGGLISLYALVEYPQVFGAAGCISTHWPAGEELMVDWMADHLPAPGKHRLYFDFGDQTLDEGYEPYQHRMDHYLSAKGFVHGKDWQTRKFPGAAHTESAWRERVDQAIDFLFQT